MTCRRTYQCNLCGTPIGITENSTPGRGVYFQTAVGANPWFKFVPTVQAEHHLCEKCISATVELASTSAISPLSDSPTKEKS